MSGHVGESKGVDDGVAFAVVLGAIEPQSATLPPLVDAHAGVPHVGQ